MNMSLIRNGRAPGWGAVGHSNAPHFVAHGAAEKVVGPSWAVGLAGNANPDEILG